MKKSIPSPDLLQGTSAHLPVSECALVADWRNFLFVHFSLPPETLAPQVPFALDLFEGRAFVSLVFFTLEGMRPPVATRVGRVLLRPVSNHPFLNVRTYVTHRGRAGICFLAEWIPNRLSTWVGPLVYGLPYRYGVFDHDVRAREGVARLAIEDPRVDASLALVYPFERRADETCEPGTAAAFLLERYRAYTFRGSVRRHFDVAHEPWRVETVDWVRTNTALITAAFPWFAAATFHSAQVSPGVTAVEMGWPHRVEEEAA